MLNRLIISPRAKKVLVITGGVFVFLFLLLLLLKSTLFHWALERQLKKINTNSEYVVAIQQSEIKGFTTLVLGEVLVANAAHDSLLYLNFLSVKINPWRVFSGKKFIRSVEGKEGFVRYTRLPAGKDTNAIEQPDSLKPSRSLAGSALRTVQAYLPSAFALRQLALYYSDSLGTIAIHLDSLEKSNKVLTGAITFKDIRSSQTWIINGSIEDKVNLRVFPTSMGALPGLKDRFDLDFRVDTLKMHYESMPNNGLNLNFGLALEANGLNLYHPKFSSDTLSFNRLAANTIMHLGVESISADSSSTFTINHVGGQFGFHFPFFTANKQYALLVKTDEAKAQDFFNSLPNGAFDDVRNLVVKGFLRYTLRFVMDGENPHDLYFESHLDKRDFAIVRQGNTNLSRMSGPFVHTVYEQGRPYRSFMVGDENPSFVPMNNVPKRLIEAILVSEDPSFFFHRGFIPEAFRESIAENYLAGRFKRGGSTISMQLIKNVFLSRKKTVFRKMEEALLVWLIEGQYLTSKERMMEVYLNVIEWGPGVYGIGEASAFYFAKKPKDLTLPECIYLANIIPRPKAFKYGFEGDGSLRRHMVDLQHFILRRMVVKEMISANDTARYNPQVILKGPARNLVVSIDTLELNLEELLDESDD